MRLRHLYKLAAQAAPIDRFCDSREPGRPTTVDFLFASVREHVRAILQTLPPVRRWLIFAVWPVMVVSSALWLVMLNGRTVKRRSGTGVVAQIRQQLKLAFHDGVFPSFYYMYEFYDPKNRAKARDYLPRLVLKPFGLYGLVYGKFPEADRSPVLGDKKLFHDMCRNNGLPTPEIFAEFSGGSVTWANPGHPELPSRDLFVKPRRAKGGRGAELWTHTAGLFTSPDGTALSPQELTARMCRKSLQKTAPGKEPEAWLAMERVANHEDLHDLTCGALNTLRIVTCRNENFEPEHIVTIFRIARDASMIVDNCHAGGLAALVDPATGIMGKATDSGVSARLGWVDRHPVTGAQIAGRKIPYWDAALNLAFRAHDCLGDAPFVGWDIAILPSGPCLIEGNKKACIEIEQRVGGPLGNGRFGELLAFHLKSGSAARSRAA